MGEKSICSRTRWTSVRPIGSSQGILRSKRISHRIEVPVSTMEISIRKLVSVQFSPVAQSCPTLCDPMDCSMPGLPVHHQLLEFSNSCPLSWWCHPTIILCQPLLLPPSVFPSIRVFANESVLCIRWLTYWSFSFRLSPSNEYSGLISFRMDWLDILGIQGILKSLFQYHSSKASILQCSAFFIVQLSHPYMTTRKTIALTRWIFVGKVMSLLFIYAV